MARRQTDVEHYARCISCGCNDGNACLVGHGGMVQGCSWILVNREKREGLCSACATVEQLVYALLAPADPLARHERAGEAITTRELADYTLKSPARIRRALWHLELKGLAERDGVATHGWFRTEAVA